MGRCIHNRLVWYMCCGLANFLINVYDSVSDSPCYLSSMPFDAQNERKNSHRGKTAVTLTSCSPFQMMKRPAMYLKLVPMVTTSDSTLIYRDKCGVQLVWLYQIQEDLWGCWGRNRSAADVKCCVCFDSRMDTRHQYSRAKELSFNPGMVRRHSCFFLACCHSS